MRKKPLPRLKACQRNWGNFKFTTYGLYRLDGMTVEDWRSGSAGGGAVVEAAYSQLGVPYVWGGAFAVAG